VGLAVVTRDGRDHPALGRREVGREAVEAAGGQVVSIPVVPGFSTSALIQAALENFG
jgi:bifunctional ADP-heptose synthase (sugar kinase/adenylyltransferase)